MKNGGHFQCFSNQGFNKTTELLAALSAFGAQDFFHILNKSASLLAHHLNDSSSFEDGVEALSDDEAELLDEEFKKLDDAFYATSPGLIVFIENYLEKNQDHFIEILD